jgi:hypothetical protein
MPLKLLLLLLLLQSSKPASSHSQPLELLLLCRPIRHPVVISTVSSEPG